MLDWRSAVTEIAWRRPPLWRALKALHPRYVALRCRLRRHPRLHWVGFEVTNACNIACTMCGSRRGGRARGLMSREVFGRRIAEIPDGSLHHVAVHAGGEPLLHPGIGELVAMARRKATTIFLSTNGQLFRGDPAQVRRLLDAGLDHLHFSAEGYDAAGYESVRVGASFAALMDALALVRRVRDESGAAAKIDLQYTLVRPHDADEIRRVLATFGPLVDEVEFRPLNNQSHPEIAYRPGERLAGVRCYRDEPLPCLALWCAVTVLWDGSVSLCPRDHEGAFVVGGSDTPLAEAWSGAAARALREAHASARPPAACRACSEPYASTLDILEMNRALHGIAPGTAGCQGSAEPARRLAAGREEG